MIMVRAGLADSRPKVLIILNNSYFIIFIGMYDYPEWFLTLCAQFSVPQDFFSIKVGGEPRNNT
jgi:hypothetical protein